MNARESRLTTVLEKAAVSLNIHTRLLATCVYDFCLDAVCNSSRKIIAHRTYFASLDDRVIADNPARLLDTFADKVDLRQSGFLIIVHKGEGEQPYPSEVLVELFIYEDLNKICSSWKLERGSVREIELQ